MSRTVPILAFLAWITILAMVLLDPSRTLPAYAFDGGRISLIIALTLVVVPAPLFPLGARSPGRFYLHVAVSLIGTLLAAAIAGSTIHRDFFAFMSPAILLYMTVFLFRIDDLELTRRKIDVYPHILTGAIVVFSLWVGWLMLMSWAIVTRLEPRWIESTAYNVNNGLIGLLFLYAAITLRDRARRTIRLRDDRLFLDERNLSEHLSPQEHRFILAFLAADDAPVTCRDLITRLHETDPGLVGRAVDCRRCLAERWTASDCSVFRNLKNRINSTRKYLELLQIGAIVPVSENVREIKEHGWQIRLFDDVRVDRSVLTSALPRPAADHNPVVSPAEEGARIRQS